MTMKVLVLGGTGTIGSAVVTALMRRGHRVVALARSKASARRLTQVGAEALAGDIRAPNAWAHRLNEFDAVVHAAASFDDTMGDSDRRLLDHLLSGLRPGARLLYTGGCWLFGATGGRTVDESAPYDAPPDFAWMVEAADRLRVASSVETIIVHPAMVFAEDGGVFARFFAEARAGGPIRVVESEAVRWPLVHASDLAELYRLALERGRPGEAYNGAAIEGAAVGPIARAIGRRYGIGEAPVPVPVREIVAELGSWAMGYGLDQRMSGAKARRELDWQPSDLDPTACLG